MAMGPRLDLRQSQSLVMTPQLRQAIKLLQSSNMEVIAFVEEELERNPLLERDDRALDPGADAHAEEAGFAEPRALLPATTGDGLDPPPVLDAFDAAAAGTLQPAGEEALDVRDWSNVADGGTESGEPQFSGQSSGSGGRSDFGDDDRGIDDLAIARPANLREHLAEQARLTFFDRQDRMIAAQFLALIDPAGRCAVPDSRIAGAMGTTVERVAAVRARMQRFDPTGMFSECLRDCLAVQLAEKNRLDPAMEALLDNLEMLARRDTRGLMRVCGVDAEDMAEMVAELRRLNPKPGADFDIAPAPIVVPDVLLRRAPDQSWIIELNPETLPRVLVNRGFLARAQVGANREAKTYLAEHAQSANWLVKSLEQRANTILKVSAEIVRRQDGFFRHGVGFLRAMILRDVAETVAMHESTVSRVTANKYIATPRGTFELKYFFTTAIAGTMGGETHSAEAVRHRIKTMVEAEGPEGVLSDDAIVLRLRDEGVDIARRTVAKYRDALRIPSSVQRKREKAVPA
ncbi:RNA polymerase RpoN-/SigL-like sigma 54 subunit [Humitalea rosea]|uniref:RNA polymerase sigma-54 factor n=1 Tax=Humitalea rosea TaxID=990373 RepID=A0A2W7IVN9_9PROT|nr:RNA polymerase factor sigma-54 [Humitalea rosea]PZW43547.1 RNA polymerase RpoN-/SigL-like sigma 54 subunit [Humitalea rosea]